MSPAHHSTIEAPYAISPTASAMGLPHSAVMIAARSCWLAMIRSNQRRSTAPRSLPVLERQLANAASAASTARRVSLPPMLGMDPRQSPDAGSVTSTVLPSSAPTHSPPMKPRPTKRDGSLSGREDGAEVIIDRAIDIEHSISRWCGGASRIGDGTE